MTKINIPFPKNCIDCPIRAETRGFDETFITYICPCLDAETPDCGKLDGCPLRP